MEAHEAIQISVSENRIVHLGGIEGANDLLVACDDDVVNGSVHEYWGTTEDGRAWRVHVAECQGHPAGPYDPMGQTVYCDGACRRYPVRS
jgi:hypothetical protein